jgi:tryptophan synthase alpha chain
VPSPSVSDTIATAKKSGRGVVIGYLPMGFPDLATSVEAAVALAEEGFDVLELGVPYSDPVMDGPLISRSTQRALEGGFKLRDLFPAISEITRRVDIPVLVMTYWNPVVQYGVEKFTTDLLAAGAKGLITPDLIPDEADEWLDISERLGAERVFLAAPSSSDERLARAVEESRGFVYAVSTMGITGTRAGVDQAAHTVVSRLREQHADSVCVGLGISTGEHVDEVLAYADGAIVGSALVRALDEGGLGQLRAVAAGLTKHSGLQAR